MAKRSFTPHAVDRIQERFGLKVKDLEVLIRRIKNGHYDHAEYLKRDVYRYTLWRGDVCIKVVVNLKRQKVVTVYPLGGDAV